VFDKLSKAEKLKRAKKLFIEASELDNSFQREAREDFEFRDGNQWTEMEKKLLSEDNRPHLTFNLIKSSVDLIMGLNEDTKVRYFAAPVEPSDDFLCEVLNDTASFVQDKSNAEESEDDAFESAVICGRGWNAVDFNPDPKRLGYIKVEFPSIPVHEVKKDPTSRRADLHDAGFIFWDKWIAAEDFKIQHPKFKNHMDEVMDTGLMMDNLTSLEPQMPFDTDNSGEEDTSDYNTPLDTNYFDRGKRMVRLIHMEYWQAYKRYYGFNPETGQPMEFEKKNLSQLKLVYPVKFNQEFEYVTIMDKKVRWFQFIGDKILYDDDSPLPYHGFSVVPCFAYSDVSKRTGNNFGIVRLMKDPQREVNKRWSQTLNWLNQQVAPGVYVEESAFVDQGQGEASLKTPGSATLLQDGALSNNRILERKVPAFPNAPMALEESAQQLMRKVTGINPDLLGMDRGRQEPGVVIRLRQQQGMMLLKPLFKSAQRMKKANFERLLAVIMEYMPDEQIMSILGQNDKYQIQDGVIFDKQYGQQADIRNIRDLKYNVNSEESPANKSKRVMDIAVFMEMRQAGFEVDPNAVIEKLDISASEKRRWLDYIAQQQQAAQQAQEQQLELEKLKIQSNMQVGMRKIDTGDVLGHEKLDETIRKDSQKHYIDKEKLTLEERRQELDFIARTAQTEATKQQAKANRTKQQAAKTKAA